MKKLQTLLMAVMLLAVLPVSAQMSSNARSFQNSVKRYLSNEGYSPYVDEDDDLCFKYQGDIYWITLGDGNNNSVYVEFHAPGWNISNLNRRKVLEAANSINYGKKCCKASVGDNYVTFTIELFAYDSSDFCKTIKRCLSVLEASREECIDYYDNN
ncbi:MAG: hypothetical protein IJ786_02585 [Bacteroidaceae bacterium]|nr:hypothetical protein [Bacteroidaceae bacterium]